MSYSLQLFRVRPVALAADQLGLGVQFGSYNSIKIENIYNILV